MVRLILLLLGVNYLRRRARALIWIGAIFFAFGLALIVDALDTAASYGLALLPDSPDEPTLTDATPVEDASVDNLVKRWFPLTNVLNSLNRSVGVTDGYPFALATPVIDKLRFVQRVIASHVVKGVS